MNQNKYKQSKLQRTQTRKILFQNNRIYLSHCQQLEDKDEFAPQWPQNMLQDESTFTDPRYSTIIKTFTKRIYKYSELLFLIRKLSRDVYSQYEALIGIHSFGNSLFTANNVLQVMGTGIVSQLVKIMVNIQHPFLQVRAVQVMIRLMQPMSRNRINLFFNMTLIPQPSMLVILSSQVDCLAQMGLKFLTRLLRTNYHIEPTDSRIDFLQVLQNLVVRWSKSSQKMGKVFSLISQFDIYYWNGRYIYNQKLCNILNKMISFQMQRQLQRSLLINSIISWTTDRSNLKRIVNLFQQNFQQAQLKHPQLFTLIETLYNFPLNSVCVEPKDWFRFILHYTSNKNGFIVLQKMKIKEKLFGLIQQYHDQSAAILILIEVFQLLLVNYVRQRKQQTVSQLMQQKYIFLQIVNIFKTSGIKQKHKVLHSTMCVIIKAYKYFDNLQILVNFDLINAFIKSSVRWDCMTMKTSFKNLRLVLQQLKNHAPADSPKSKFMDIAKLVVSDTNYELIKQGLQANYLNDISDLRVYYQNLKNTVDKTIIQQQRKGSDIFIQQKEKNEDQDAPVGQYFDLYTEKT